MSHEVINTALLVVGICFAGLIYYRSHSWTGPAQHVRIGALEDEQRVIRGNLARVERDTTDWHREFSNSLDEILRQLQTIQRNGAKEHPLEELAREAMTRLEDLEQYVATLPCTPQCPPSKDKE